MKPSTQRRNGFPENYSVHRWQSRLAGGPPDVAESYERVCVCVNCGCENMGDPAEFPELNYPHCVKDGLIAGWYVDESGAKIWSDGKVVIDE